MRYWKKVADHYITAVGVGFLGEEITKTEYDEILSAIFSVPAVKIGYGYRLKEDLTWEEYKLPETEETEDISDTEALEILLGGAV